MAGGLLIALLFSVFMIARVSRGRGVAEGTVKANEAADVAVNKQNEVVAAENKAIVQEVEKTNATHDRLNTDPEFARVVRDRFTRDD